MASNTEKKVRDKEGTVRRPSIYLIGKPEKEEKRNEMQEVFWDIIDETSTTDDARTWCRNDDERHQSTISRSPQNYRVLQ